MVYLTTDDVGGSLRDLLDVYLNWNGIIGYTSDIMDYWEDIFDKDEEGIKEFLDEEGIYGYTTDILDLLNSGEVTISDMDEEDFMKLKRQLGIYESMESGKGHRRSLIDESQQINEGPGAGYTISGKLEDVKINDFEVINQYQIDDLYPDDFDYTVYEISCDIDGILEDVDVNSYYYGGSILSTPVKITHMEIFADGDPQTPTEEWAEAILEGDFEIHATVGGGWTHATFDGELLLNHPNEWDYNSNIALKDINIKFTDPQAIDAVDKYATGENYTVEFSVLDEDEYEVEFFDNKEDAIKYAEENNLPYVSEIHWGWEYSGDGEYETTDRADSSEIIWTNEDFGE